MDEVCANKMIGGTVYDLQTAISAGSVISSSTRVVLDVGSFLNMGGKYVAIPISEHKTDSNRLTLDRTQEQLRQIEAYQLENPDTGPVTRPHRRLADASAPVRNHRDL